VWEIGQSIVAGAVTTSTAKADRLAMAECPHVVAFCLLHPPHPSRCDAHPPGLVFTLLPSHHHSRSFILFPFLHFPLPTPLLARKREQRLVDTPRIPNKQHETIPLAHISSFYSLQLRALLCLQRDTLTTHRVQHPSRMHLPARAPAESFRDQTLASRHLKTPQPTSLTRHSSPGLLLDFHQP
jgi:hypothetical protein